MLPITADSLLLFWIIPALCIAGIGFLFASLSQYIIAWPIRWAIALTTLNMLLIRPTVELFAVGLSLFCTLEVLAALRRRRQRSSRGSERLSYRFSLSSLCFCMIIIAVVSAVYRTSPSQFSIETLGLGCVAGIVVFVTTVLTDRRREGGSSVALENETLTSGSKTYPLRTVAYRCFLGVTCAAVAACILASLIPLWPAFDMGSVKANRLAYLEQWIHWTVTFSQAMLLLSVLILTGRKVSARWSQSNNQQSSLRCISKLCFTGYGNLFLFLLLITMGTPSVLVLGLSWPGNRPALDTHRLTNYQRLAETCMSIVPDRIDHLPSNGKANVSLIARVENEPEKVSEVLSLLKTPLDVLEYSAQQNSDSRPLLSLMNQYGAIRSVLAVKLEESKSFDDDLELSTSVLNLVSQLRRGAPFHIYIGREIERLVYKRLLYIWPRLSDSQRDLVRKRVTEFAGNRSTWDEVNRNEFTRLRFFEPWQTHLGAMVRNALGSKPIPKRSFEICDLPLRQFFLSVAVIESERLDGTAPDNLSSLTRFEWIKPEYLIDPWADNDGEFRYIPRGHNDAPQFEIYSVGPNGKDDGGMLQRPNTSIDDVGLQ